MKTISLFSVVVLLMVFTSCKKDRFMDDPKAPQTMEELTVPSSFDWKTTKDVQLTVQAGNSGIVEVTNNQNIVYQKAFLSPGQSYIMNLTLPSYENKIKIRHAGQEISVDITGNSLNYTFQ